MTHIRSLRGPAATLFGALLSLTLFACSAPEPEVAQERAAPEPVPALSGIVEQSEIEDYLPDWVEIAADATVDPVASLALGAVPPGAEVTVYFGSWCGDSKRELSRFWRALDEAGADLAAMPFELEYIGVERGKKEPAELIEGSNLLYVPTFIVERDGEEIGRIVEMSPGGIESDLLGLLNGETSGLITAKAELLEDDPAETSDESETDSEAAESTE